MNIVIVDHYDSFTYNLVHLFAQANGAQITVVRCDSATATEVAELRPHAIVLSPGPGSPADPKYFGVSSTLLRELSPRVPTLGICLGHQGIAHVFGGSVIRAPEPRHGKTSRIGHNGSRLFDGIPATFEAMRYHSLMVSHTDLPAELRVTSETDGIIMSLEHIALPIFGVQFHPESIGTSCGAQLARNFLAIASDAGMQ
jgi:anthranilate synthase/aminodeoxychorismate synthase-like glutamine amidotransferase